MELFEGVPVLNITIDKIHQGTNRISLVDLPAFEFDWLKFAKETDSENLSSIVFNFEELAKEQKLAGPFIIPGKLVPRKHPETKQLFYVRFSAEVVREIADRFNANLYGSNFNTDHEDNVEGVHVSENWIIENTKLDKASYKFGHQLPAGTWYGVVKVTNTKLWTEQIATGNLKGFSVEMLAGLNLAMDNAIIEETALSKLEELGEVPGENWQLVSIEDIAENEDELTAEQILSALDFRIVAKPDEDSRLDRTKADGSGIWKVRYRYDGPQDSRNRNFCGKMLRYQGRTGKVFRKEDIDQMSFRTENGEFGTYSIFKYKGSYGCRHRWKRLIFFVDIEAGETRRVANVPAVKRVESDQDATEKNRPVDPKKRENFNSINMKNEKQKFAKVEELDAEGRVKGAKVDDENGEVVVEGITYVIENGEIMEIKEPTTENAETMAEHENETKDPETTDAETTDEGDAWKTEVMNKLAELEAKVEALTSKISDGDAGTTEEFGKVVEQLLSKFKTDLTPGTNGEATDKKSQVELELSQVELVTKTLDEIRKRD